MSDDLRALAEKWRQEANSLPGSAAFDAAEVVIRRCADALDAALADPTCRLVREPPPDWQPIETAPEDVPVLTKIDDEHGCRNEQPLKRRGRLWFFTDGSMYVYYTPTHWMLWRGAAQESGT